MVRPAAASTEQVWNEEDARLVEPVDIPIVIAYNGVNHFAPTKPLRGTMVDAIRRERIYEVGWLMRYYLNRQVPNPQSWTDGQRAAWNNLSDALSDNLAQFRSPFRTIDQVYQGPVLPTLKHRLPRPGDREEGHPVTGKCNFFCLPLLTCIPTL